MRLSTVWTSRSSSAVEACSSSSFGMELKMVMISL
jgi:hypothetical protein